MEKDGFKKEFKKRLYNFVLKLIEFLDQLPKDNVSKRIGDQLLRSGTSILGNYVEGQSASSKKDFINYFNHSLKSSNESKLWLSLLKDSKRGNSDEVDWFLAELDEISKIFASSILTLKKNQKLKIKNQNKKAKVDDLVKSPKILGESKLIHYFY